LTLGQKIVKLRNQKGWSQDVFGEKIGVHGRRVSLYENDKSNPSLETLIQIAKAFEVSFDYLLADSLDNHSNVFVNDKSLMPFIVEFDHLNEEDKKTVKSMIEAIARR
jgi:transcriptional regulator with XRE-family HTH domain